MKAEGLFLGLGTVHLVAAAPLLPQVGRGELGGGGRGRARGRRLDAQGIRETVVQIYLLKKQDF